MDKLSDEYTIYAVKAIQPWEKGGNYWIPLIYEEIKQGSARFGWGSYDGADIRKIKEKADKQGWNTLTEDESDIWFHVGFMLTAKLGDYFVYINMPSYGNCTTVRITGEYDFGEVWDRDKEGDFRHFHPCEFIGTFDRNSPIVHPFLRQRLGLQRAWYRIYAKNEFEELLDAIQKGEEGKTAKERLEAEINNRLAEIAQEVYRNFPRKNLEDLLYDVFTKVPNVKNVRKGPDVNGADIEIEFETGLGLGGLQNVESCAVQVKAYEGTMGYTKAIEDIKKAFNSDPKYTSGLIVSTALEMTGEFERELEKVRQEAKKEVGILIGKDLARFLMKYGID